MTFRNATLRSPLRPLKHCCHVNPAVLSETTDPDWEFEYIDIGSVSLSEGITHKERIRFAASPSRARKPVQKGDVLVSTVRTYLRAIAAIEASDAPQVASTGFAVLRAKQGTNSRFLYRVVQSHPFVEQVVAQSTGVSYPAINPSVLSNMEIPHPELATQEAIADFLDRETDRIDQLIEKKRRFVSVTMERRTDFILAAATRGLDAAAKYSPSGLELAQELPSHWKPTRLKYLGQTIIGLTYSSDELVPEGEGIPVIRANNIQSGRLVSDGFVFVARNVPNKLKLRVGDIVICSRNGSRSLIGKNAKVSEKYTGMTFGAFNTVFRSEYSDFIYWILQSPIFSYQAGAYLTSTINQLTITTLGNLVVPVPPLAEQKAICRHIESKVPKIDRLLEQVKISIEHLKEFRSALITAAITGQIDMATWGKQGQTDRRLDEIEEAMQA